MSEFLVEDRPWTMRPQFRKLQGPLRDAELDPSYLEQKQLELKTITTPLWFCTESAESVLSEVAYTLKIKPGSILDLGLQLNEDLVVMHHGKLQAGFIAFPSGWNPAEKQNKSLAEIHDPVADGDELRAASSRISAMMCNGQGPWCRYVWTVTSNPKLSNHPQHPSVTPKNLNDLYFRYEYQTFDTVRLGSTSVFLIKTVVLPYKKYVDTAAKHSIVTRVIESMSDSVLTYKNLHQVKSIIKEQPYEL